MKTSTHLFYLLLCLLSPYLLSASDLCSAPAPASGMIISHGSDFARATWAEVPGALSYEVTTLETSSGNVLTQSIVIDNTYEQTGLSPATDYNIEIRASYCAFGSYGSPISLHVRTEIVIVDIILQMECDDGGISTTQTVAVGDKTELDFEALANGCYDINIETVIDGETINVSFSLKHLPSGDLLFGNPSGNPSGFQTSGNGPLMGSFNSGNEPGNISLFSLSVMKKQQQNIEVEIEWLWGATIIITPCANCEFIYDRGGDFRILPTQETAIDFKISPNPVNSLLSLQRPEEGVLQIWDLNGRKWLDIDSPTGGVKTSLEIDVSDWPRGVYLLQWHQPSSPPSVQYFLKI